MSAYKSAEKAGKLTALKNLGSIMKEAEAKGTKSGKRPAGSPDVGDASAEVSVSRKETKSFTKSGSTGGSKRTPAQSSHTEKYPEGRLPQHETAESPEFEAVEESDLDQAHDGDEVVKPSRANPGDTRAEVENETPHGRLGDPKEVDSRLKAFLVKKKTHRY